LPTFFDSHFKDQQNTRRWLLQKTIKQPPLRLQAYERMTLFMERINPSQLMVRIVPSETKRLSKFCNSTDRAFEHNLSQQIYISEKCWSIISYRQKTRQSK
jgi:hypothetical protein